MAMSTTPPSVNIVLDKDKLALLQGRLGIKENHQNVMESTAPEIIDITEDPMEKVGELSHKAMSNGPWDAEGSLHSSSYKHRIDDSDKDPNELRENTPKRVKVEVQIDPSPENTNSRGTLPTLSAVGMRKIDTYFTTGEGGSLQFKSRSTLKYETASGAAPSLSTLQPTEKVTILSNSSSTSASSWGGNIGELKKQNEALRVYREQAEQKAQRLEAELRSSGDRYRQVEDRNSKLAAGLEEVYRTMAHQEARRKRDRAAADCVRLGKIATVRTSATSIGDVWEEGYALKELTARTTDLCERREELEKRRNRLKSVKKKLSSTRRGQGTDMEEDGEYSPSALVTDLDIIAEESAIRMHMEQLKKDETALVEEKRMLEAEKAAHQKELKRCQSEDRSRFFRDLPCLNGRYLLLSMLGRGGFSEVWKALDLTDLAEVAVKVHQLNASWSDSRKQSYVKHVTREYTIHRDLNHPRVVRLFDVFEIDVHSFATVLELCRGTDLDEKLKTCKMIPEKDAKTIIMQIVSGLRYLHAPLVSTSSSTMLEDASDHGPAVSAQDVAAGACMMPPSGAPTRRRSIIHFDLKPANILFDHMGDAKITDFGLSKIMDEADEGMTSLELTSQGAGTYWYLPPECFSRGDAPPRISNKVDVWSLGVIFYQMLYGKRPFGEGKSQERVLSEGIMLNATQVDFPPEGSTSGGPNSVWTSPKVSDEAKDFIKACLTWDQRHRPDVLSLCQHPYLRPPQKKI